MEGDVWNHPAVRGCVEALGRCAQVVDSLTDEQYLARYSDHDSIGAHMRHCIEYFRCFFEGLDDKDVDYDARKRDQSLEQSRSACKAALEEIGHRVASIPPDTLTGGLLFHETLDSSHTPAKLSSSTVRELAYLSQHTIHHLAIITVIADLGGFRLPADLGLACSTAAFRKSQESGR